MFGSGISESEKKLGAHEKLAKADFPDGGVVEKRTSTDILFLLALILAWAAMTAVGSDAVQKGRPDALVNGFDYKGRLCGFDSGVEGSPNKYPVLASGVGTCVEFCPTNDGTPTTTAYDSNVQPSAQSNWRDIVECTVDSPSSADKDCMWYQYLAGGSITYGVCPCTYKYESQEIFNHCLITDPEVLSFISDSRGGTYLTDFIADIKLSAPVIFGFGYGAALLLGLFYCRLLRVGWLAYMLVWFCIFTVMGAMWVMTGFMWTKALEWSHQDPALHTHKEILALKIVSWTSGCLSFLYVCFMLAMRKRINLAIAMVKEAAACMQAFPIIVFTPVVQYLGIALFLIPWVFYVIYLAGMATITRVTIDVPADTVNNIPAYSYSAKEVEYSTEVYHRGWYMIFILFWTLNFVVALGQIANAMAVSTWYFTRNKEDVGNSTVVSAYKKTIRYHMGTAAFGSLIIAIVETVRAYCAYLQKQAKKSKNKVMELVMCCLGCMLWCIEKCLKFICTQAYIQTAMFSKSFCFACKDVVFLILRNIARVSAVTMVSGFILLIGKIFITGATGVVSYFFLANYYDDKLHSLIAPTVLIVFLAWYTAGMFCEVWSMAIDTILVCFITDEEVFEPGERYADGDLRSFIDTHGTKPIKAKKEGEEEGERKEGASSPGDVQMAETGASKA